MDNVTDVFFSEMGVAVKQYIMDKIPFIDDREKHIYILLSIGNTSLNIAKRLGVKLDDVLFDRDNLFKKINLFLGPNFINTVHGCVTQCKEINDNKKELLFSVYVLTFPDKKVYVGVSCDVNKRWSNGHGYKQNKAMHQAIIDCGWDNVKKEILYVDLPYDDAREKEKALILEHKSCDKQYGYNRAI